MAHFAELDENNVVKRVVVVHNNECLDASGVERESIGAAFCQKLFGGRWVQTSYSGSIRGLFACENYVYDPTNDVFYDPQVTE